MCVCVCVCLCIGVYVCVCARVGIYMCVLLVCADAYVYEWVYISMCGVRGWVYVWLHAVCISMCMCIFVYICGL